MVGRRLLLVIPSAAMAVVGFALFGPGAIRPFEGGQIWGGPTEGARRFSWRVVAMDRVRGIDRASGARSLVVRARARSGQQGVARCRTRTDGSCDVEVSLPGVVRGGVHAELMTEDGVTLARGDFERNAARWDEGPVHPARLTGRSEGDLELLVFARRGVFAAPFRDELVVAVNRGATAASGANVTLRAEGADIDGDATDAGMVTVTASERGEATFVLTPLTHTITARVEVASAGYEASWNGILPVIPGAFWLDPASAARTIRVVAPVPREVAFATLATRSSRLWGGVVPLSFDARGFSSGQIDWPDVEVAAGEPLWLTLASDASGAGMGTVGWPVARPGQAHGALAEDELPFRDWLLLDGMPVAEQRDSERRGRARRLSALALGAAAVVEGLLLARGSHAKGARSWAWLVVAIATVAFAFAALGVVAMWRTGG
jgi:hypothetical protein